MTPAGSLPSTAFLREEMARQNGAEVIDFSQEDPVEAIKGLTGGIGVDRAIDAVGVDAVAPQRGPAARKSKEHEQDFKQELKVVAPKANPQGDNWRPGDAPSQAIMWAVDVIAKAGTLAVIGVYPETVQLFPFGQAMEKNLSLKMGNCNHRKYIPKLVDMVRSRVVDPTEILTQRQPLTSAIEAYKTFDRREPGWMKVELKPVAA